MMTLTTNEDMDRELIPIMYPTTAGVPLSAEILRNYFETLVNLIFKILPIWEKSEENEDNTEECGEDGGCLSDQLGTYMLSLQQELLGCREFIDAIHDDSEFLSILSILQYLINHPDSEIAVVRRNVFGAISKCNKLCTKYAKTREVRG